jgi:hypothetical protein
VLKKIRIEAVTGCQKIHNNDSNPRTFLIRMEKSDKAAYPELNIQFSQVLHLASWPSLSELSLDTAPHITRICALLARRPSVGMVIPRMLDMPSGMTYSLLKNLYANGHVYPAVGLLSGQAVLSDAEPVQISEPGVTSFFGKLWQRLMRAE